MRKRTYAMRYVAGQPAERIFPPGEMHYPGQVLPTGSLLLEGDVLRVMVWNIFKQQRMNWLSVLKNFGKGTQLVLLKEAQSTPELIR
ncbi:EEP domain-containing protein, partial [Pectobacterium brasiliense]|nr:EEP domain-containing protein [Pectobacterium brasiliense]